LEVLNKRSNRFTEHDKELAETLAAQAGISLQRARLLEQAKGRGADQEATSLSRRYHRLLEITRMMAGTADLPALLGIIIDRSIELLSAERASLFLYEPDSQELVSRVASECEEIRFKVDLGIAGATIREGKTIVVDDAPSDPRFNPDIDRRTGYHTRSILSVPLLDCDGGWVGVLQVLNKRGAPFDSQDKVIAETLAAQAGVSLQRARLMERTVGQQRDEVARRQARDQKELLDITLRMAGTVDLETLLELIIERGVQLLDAERASVFLYQPDSDEVIARVARGVDEIRCPADRGIVGATLRQGQTLRVDDAYADPRFNPEIDRRTGFRTRSLISVPLRDIGGELVGVLQILNKRAEHFSDYDIQLAETLGAQAGVGLQRARLIADRSRAREMEKAMAIAQQIQCDLLPTASPSICGFDVAGFSQPADLTGGDTYDYLPLPDGRWMVAVADASGHGLGPALVIAQTRAMLRAMSMQAACPSVMLRAVNDLLCRDLGEERFVTCLVGVLDPLAGLLTLASAGHGPALVYQVAHARFREIGATDLPLGILPDATFDQQITVAFRPGDTLVIPTDGISDAWGMEGERFGTERIESIIRRDHRLPCERIAENLRRAVCIFSDGTVQSDDLTALVIKRKA
jgi:phosphoserine phosphatase